VNFKKNMAESDIDFFDSKFLVENTKIPSAYIDKERKIIFTFFESTIHEINKNEEKSLVKIAEDSKVKIETFVQIIQNDSESLEEIEKTIVLEITGLTRNIILFLHSFVNALKSIIKLRPPSFLRAINLLGLINIVSFLFIFKN
jgi:hypothetical protein